MDFRKQHNDVFFYYLAAQEMSAVGEHKKIVIGDEQVQSAPVQGCLPAGQEGQGEGIDGRWCAFDAILS